MALNVVKLAVTGRNSIPTGTTKGTQITPVCIAPVKRLLEIGFRNPIASR